jgi:hypothetical protein
MSEDENKIKGQDVPEYGHIRPEVVPLDLSITNSSVKPGKMLGDGAAEIFRNSSGE